MKMTVILSLALAVFGAHTSFGAEKTMHVVGSSKLQLIIVDSARATPTRDAIHEAFSASLKTAMEAACGGPVEVQAKSQNADQAAFGLDSGCCHVVLSLGKTIPRPLVKSDMERLNATLGAEKNEKKAYLVFSKADEGLKKLLTTSFAAAITDSRFLDALDGGIDTGVDLPKGKVLAAAGR